MFAKLYYKTKFIVSVLPYEKQFDGEDAINYEEDGDLILTTAHGRTTWKDGNWKIGEEDNEFICWGDATYKGAWNALNATQGIKFPDCEISEIQSTYGFYESANAYEIARTVVKNIQVLIGISDRQVEIPQEIIDALCVFTESLVSIPYPSCGDRDICRLSSSPNSIQEIRKFFGKKI